MNSFRLTPWLLYGACLLAATACNRKKDDVAPALMVQVSYAQTYCADRWNQGQNLSIQQLPTAAAAYLAQQGITLAQPSATQKNQAELCYACTCKTGVVLEGSVSPADLPTVLALGFQQ